MTEKIRNCKHFLGSHCSLYCTGGHAPISHLQYGHRAAIGEPSWTAQHVHRDRVLGRPYTHNRALMHCPRGPWTRSHTPVPPHAASLRHISFTKNGRPTGRGMRVGCGWRPGCRKLPGPARCRRSSCRTKDPGSARHTRKRGLAQVGAAGGG